MTRVAFLYDGLNLRHSMLEAGIPEGSGVPDLVALSRMFLRQDQSLSLVFYFTALVPWSDKTRADQEKYIRRAAGSGVMTKLGRFHRVQKRCPICSSRYTTFEEKETDLNIGIRLMAASLDDAADEFVIVSGDSDLIPALSEARHRCPEKRYGVLVPPGRRADALIHSADFAMKMKRSHIDKALN